MPGEKTEQWDRIKIVDIKGGRVSVSSGGSTGQPVLSGTETTIVNYLDTTQLPFDPRRNCVPKEVKNSREEAARAQLKKLFGD